MTRILFAALAGSFLFPITATQGLKPIYSVQKGTVALLSHQQNQIIHESQNRWILKRGKSTTADNLYYVQLTKNVSVIKLLKSEGTLVEYFEDEFAVWKPRNSNSIGLLSAALHEEGGHCGTIQKLHFTPLEIDLNKPKALISEKDEGVTDAVAKVKGDNIYATIQTLQDWGSRYHKDSEGMLAGDKLKALYEALVPEDREDVELELVEHIGSPQKSLIVRILGSESPEEIVIIGSHLDSINRIDNTFAPGADDNASGTATNLEAFRVLMANNIAPKKTIEFHAYAAEEIGLVGSGEIAQSYKDAKKNVLAMVQFDMNGYAKKGLRTIYFVSNKTNKTLTKTLQKISDNYVDIPHKKKRLWAGSSDHASWNRLGFPVAFPTENPRGFNPTIHTSEDTLENINSPEQMAEFAKLAVAYLLSFAGY